MKDQHELQTTYADLLGETPDPTLTQLIQHIDTLSHGPQAPSSCSWQTIKSLHTAQSGKLHPLHDLTHTNAVISPPRQNRTRHWMRVGSGLAAAVLLLGILVGSLLFSAHAGPFQVFQQPNRHITLVASQHGRVPTPQALEQAQTILLNRFQHIGLTNTQVHVITTHGQARISLDLVSLSGNEQQALSTLLATGILQVWDTGPATDLGSLLQPGVTFHLTDYTQYNPGGKSGFANQDFNPNAFSASKDPQSGTYRVNFALQGSAITHFQNYTAARIGDVLTITLDDTVITSAVIQSPIPGSGAIVGNFTQAQANALAATLASGVLPIRLTPA